jgi:LytS/YehU family sensor histidine kinase
MLDNLITYLRAALPQMRTTASTLGQELQLAQAYLNIQRIRAQGRLDFAFNVPDGLCWAAFPPMVLLPLIEALMLRDRKAAEEGGVLRAEARADAGVLKLTLTVMRLREAQATADVIESIRRRLSALYGAAGKLRLDPLNPHGIVARLELPHVAT